MTPLIDKLYTILRQELNPFLQERGLPPIRRFSLHSFSSDILPSLNIALKEFALTDEPSSVKEKVWRGTFIISLLLREDGERDSPLLGPYVQALREFLEGMKTLPIIKGTCMRISPIPSKKPLQRGISIEFEILYLP